jgi:hypothetical protein
MLAVKGGYDAMRIPPRWSWPRGLVEWRRLMDLTAMMLPSPAKEQGR